MSVCADLACVQEHSSAVQCRDMTKVPGPLKPSATPSCTESVESSTDVPSSSSARTVISTVKECPAGPSLCYHLKSITDIDCRGENVQQDIRQAYHQVCSNLYTLSSSLQQVPELRQGLVRQAVSAVLEDVSSTYTAPHGPGRDSLLKICSQLAVLVCILSDSPAQTPSTSSRAPEPLAMTTLANLLTKQTRGLLNSRREVCHGGERYPPELHVPTRTTGYVENLFNSLVEQEACASLPAEKPRLLRHGGPHFSMCSGPPIGLQVSGEQPPEGMAANLTKEVKRRIVERYLQEVTRSKRQRVHRQ